MLYGIDVVIVAPGSIATPIWDKAEQIDTSPYESTDYFESALRVQKYMIQNGRNGYPPEKVGEVVLHTLTTAKPRVRYSVIPGSSFQRIIQMLLPKRMVDKIIARRLGFRK
jgi:short-subunit dehydrogenase